MPTKSFRMTNTELKLKRERMMVAFKAGREALQELGLPYFLAYSSALAALREGQFQPHEDDVNVGIYAWDLAKLQRQCAVPSAAERDGRLRDVFGRWGFDPVSEMLDGPAALAEAGPDAQNTMNACPRYFLAEGWHEEMAYPILYKFSHRESLVRFDVQVFASQFGQLWDFADGGAETSSGWRYSLFSPQPVEFEKVMTFTMPAKALEEHYGQDWHVPRAYSYIDNLSRCENRCQVLRVHPFDAKLQRLQLPPAVPWEEFRPLMRQYRIKYAKAMADAPYEVPPKPLDLYKIESKPLVLFQSAGICKSEGNERLKSGNFQGAIDKYDEGLYIMDKCREVLLTWRLVFRQIHDEKAEKDRQARGLKLADLVEPDMPREFRSDEMEQQHLRLTLLLNAAQAALQARSWDVVESRASLALELEPKNAKALYRRGMARLGAGRLEAAKSDFWAMLKASGLESKEALSQLMKLIPKDEFQRQLRKFKAAFDRETKLGGMISEMEEDERISWQEERYQRYMSDCEQRREDGQKQITFDEWVRQYEWRYDADERAKVRSTWPEYFSHMGPAPLPVEEWEVDYLTHKEVDKIMYRRQTEAMAARRRAREGRQGDGQEEPKEGFTCTLQVDLEDERVLREAVVKKGYTYWW